MVRWSITAEEDLKRETRLVEEDLQYVINSVIATLRSLLENGAPVETNPFNLLA